MTPFEEVKIGILIPTFNRCAYLADALRSARGQTFENIEIVVIDNGSADGTTAFMESVSDPRVRYVINETNIGMIGSINKGMSLFSDEVRWCTILGDDDLLDKDFLMKLLQSATDSNAKSIIHSHRVFIDEQGYKIREATISPHEETAFDYMKMRAYTRRETYLTGVLFNREAFKKINGYPAFATGLTSDDAFIFALAIEDRLVFERRAVAFIRLHKKAESLLCSNGMMKLGTIKQFGEYCERVANENGAFGEEQLREFASVFKAYLRALSSFWWIQTAHRALDDEENYQEQLSQILLLAKNNQDTFTFRVKLAIACQQVAGFFPEASEGYRRMWDIISKISQWLRKYVP